MQVIASVRQARHRTVEMGARQLAISVTGFLAAGICAGCDAGPSQEDFAQQILEAAGDAAKICGVLRTGSDEGYKDEGYEISVAACANDAPRLKRPFAVLATYEAGDSLKVDALLTGDGEVLNLWTWEGQRPGQPPLLRAANRILRRPCRSPFVRPGEGAEKLGCANE